MNELPEWIRRTLAEAEVQAMVFDLLTPDVPVDGVTEDELFALRAFMRSTGGTMDPDAIQAAFSALPLSERVFLKSILAKVKAGGDLP